MTRTTRTLINSMAGLLIFLLRVFFDVVVVCQVL